VWGTYADSDGGEAAECDEEGEEYGESVGPDLGEHRHRVHLHRNLSLQYATGRTNSLRKDRGSALNMQALICSLI